VRASADSLLHAEEALDRGGLNVRAAIPIDRYDALVPPAFRSDRLLPGAASTLVIGSGGRALFAAFLAAPEGAGERDPLDTYTARVVSEAVRNLERAGIASRVVHALEDREGRFADLVALGRAAGLGWPSRLGLLLNPHFGPWMSLRAVLLSTADFEIKRELPDCGPCADCPAPCAVACPGAAVVETRFDVSRCEETRRTTAGCRHRCAARRACPIGLDHAYTERAESHHMDASYPDSAGGG
jgi:hypothetical protein